MKRYASSALMAAVLLLGAGNAGLAFAQDTVPAAQDGARAGAQAVPAVPTHDDMRAQFEALFAADATDEFIAANIANPDGVPAIRTVGSAMRQFPNMSYRFVDDPVVDGLLMTQVGQFTQLDNNGNEVGSKPKQDFIYQVKGDVWALSNDMVCALLKQATLGAGKCPVVPGEDLPSEGQTPTDPGTADPTEPTDPSDTDAPDPTEPTDPSDTDKPEPSNTDKPEPSNTDKPEPSNTDKPKPSNTDKPKPSNTDKPKPSNSPKPTGSPLPTDSPRKPVTSVPSGSVLG